MDVGKTAERETPARPSWLRLQLGRLLLWLIEPAMEARQLSFIHQGRYEPMKPEQARKLSRIVWPEYWLDSGKG